MGVISITQKSYLPYRRIDKLKMATATLDRFFDLPTYLFCIDCFTAELGPREAEGLVAGDSKKQFKSRALPLYRGEKLL